MTDAKLPKTERRELLFRLRVGGGDAINDNDNGIRLAAAPDRAIPSFERADGGEEPHSVLKGNFRLSLPPERVVPGKYQ